MRLPPDPVLLAVRRWLEILPTSGGLRRAQSLLTTHVRYSDLTPTQYQAALTWLREVDLLNSVGSTTPVATRVLAVIFEKAAPSWFRDADELVQTPDELPSDIVSAGKTLGLDANRVFSQLVASWGKVDIETRRRVGEAGEVALVELLRTAVGAQVDHVAAWSDGFGYDIAFLQGSVIGHLEVKSTKRSGRFTAYLSRHEYRVMLRDESWMLATVRLTADLTIAGVGSVPRDWISANVPHDDGPFGRWASVKLEIPAEVITSGLPRLGTVPGNLLPPW